MTTLFVKCPQCHGRGTKSRAVSGAVITESCACQDGYMQIGYTLERFDALAADRDRLLILLGRVAAESNLTLAVTTADERRDDIDAAKSRTKR